MKSITWYKPSGEWGVAGVDMATLPPVLYGALHKLLHIEHPEILGDDTAPEETIAALREENEHIRQTHYHADVVKELQTKLDQATNEFCWYCRAGHNPAECAFFDADGVIICNTDKLSPKPEDFAVELADCIIRILDWCCKEGVDIDAIIKFKRDIEDPRILYVCLPGRRLIFWESRDVGWYNPGRKRRAGR